MSWERVWKLDLKHLDLSAVRAAAEGAAGAYEGVSVEVEWEADDTITCFFLVPSAAGDAQIAQHDLDVEISVYDLGPDGRVLSLEGDAADNDAAFDDACQLAEDMADALGGRQLEM